MVIVVCMVYVAMASANVALALVVHIANTQNQSSLMARLRAHVMASPALAMGHATMECVCATMGMQGHTVTLTPVVTMTALAMAHAAGQQASAHVMQGMRVMIAARVVVGVKKTSTVVFLVTTLLVVNVMKMASVCAGKVSHVQIVLELVMTVLMLVVVAHATRNGIVVCLVLVLVGSVCLQTLTSIGSQRGGAGVGPALHASNAM